MAGLRFGLPQLVRLSVAGGFALTILLYVAILTSSTATVSIENLIGQKTGYANFAMFVLEGKGHDDAEHAASRVLQEALSAELLPLAAELPQEIKAAEPQKQEARIVPPPDPEKARLEDLGRGGPPIDQGGMDQILDRVPDPVKENPVAVPDPVKENPVAILDPVKENPVVIPESVKESPVALPDPVKKNPVVFPDPVKERPVAEFRRPEINPVRKVAVITNVEVSQSVEKKISIVSISSKTQPPNFENPPVVTSALYESGHSVSSKICGENKGSDLRLLVLVTTAPGHAAARSGVRGTWGHIALRKDVALAFFVGKSGNETENRMVRDESIVYDDMIQGNFMDTYNNLTLKTISMLEWVSEHCSRTSFILKTDDDMYINFQQLFKILSAVKRPRLIFGKLAQKWKPVRNESSKYYIPPSLYPYEYYPDFTTGPAYVLTGDIIKELYRESLKGMFYKLEDVYVTGIIAKKLRIDHMHFEQFINRLVPLDTCLVKQAVSIHMVRPFEMYDLWKRLSDGLESCTNRVVTSTSVSTKSVVKINQVPQV